MTVVLGNGSMRNFTRPLTLPKKKMASGLSQYISVSSGLRQGSPSGRVGVVSSAGLVPAY